MSRAIAAFAAAALPLTAGPSLAKDDSTLKANAKAVVGGPLIQQLSRPVKARARAELPE